MEIVGGPRGRRRARVVAGLIAVLAVVGVGAAGTAALALRGHQAGPLPAGKPRVGGPAATPDSPRPPIGVTLPSTIDEPRRGDAVVAEPPPDPDPAPQPDAEPDPSEALRSGMEGVAVESLQRRLNEIGYTITEVDGIFGDETVHAVVAFQKVNGLSRDGVVGPLTFAALDRATRPEPRAAGSGFHVEVHLDLQVLYLVRDGEVTDVYDASTGSGGTYVFEGDVRVARTPVGEFSVQRKIDGLRVAPLGVLYRPAYFYGGYAIHGSPSVPPYPASHGCVRVTNHAMDQLFDLLAIGTPVSVYS